MSEEEREPLRLQAAPEQTRLWTATLVASALACVVGSSFQVGYNTGVLNSPEQVFKEFYNDIYVQRSRNETAHFPETPLVLLWSLTVSIFCVGGMLGGLGGGFLSSRLGRKKLMLLNNATLVVACVLMFSSDVALSYEILIAGRFIVGLHSGVSTVVAPLYLSEVAPLALKGAFGTLNQLAIVAGVLVSQAVGLEEVLGGSRSFLYLLVVPVCPAVIQVVTLACCPESPYWLRMSKRDVSETRKTLRWLRQSDDVDMEMAILASEIADEERSGAKVWLKDFVVQRHLRRALLVALCMQLSQQLSGINAVTYYSTSIFEYVGIHGDNPRYATLGLGGVMMAMTLVSAVLVDVVGRRQLHLAGLGGMLVSLTVLTVALSLVWNYDWMSYFGIAALISFVISFGIGPGSIPWFITAELFQHNARGHAVAMANFVNWLANFIVGLMFPVMQEGLHQYAFVPFIVLLFGFIVFTYSMVPETKNRTVEDIVAQLKMK